MKQEHKLNTNRKTKHFEKKRLNKQQDLFDVDDLAMNHYWHRNKWWIYIYSHLIAILDILIYCFQQGSGGAAPLVNAVTEFNDAFNDVIDSNFSLVAEKENVGTFFKLCAEMLVI